MQGDDREPEFVTAFEYKHDHVAPFYSQWEEKSGGFVALAFDVGKCEIDVVVLFIGPAKRFFLRGDAGPFVYDIVSEVEIFGYIYTEVFNEIFLGGEFRLF